MNNLLLFYESSPNAQLAQEGAMARRWFSRFELVLGFQPFRMDYPLDADAARLKLYRPGLLVMSIYLVALVGSFIVTYLAMQPEYIGSNDNVIIDKVYEWLAILYFWNAIFFSALVIFRRKVILKVAPLERCIDAHLQQMSIDWIAFHRKCGRILWVSMAYTVLIVTFFVGLEWSVWSWSTPPDQRYLIVFYTMASIVPFLYAVVVVIQFVVNVWFLKCIMEQVNGAMQRFCDSEQNEWSA